MIDRTYFVYQHRRPDTGEIFYIGKGCRTPLKKYIRANTTSRRNIHWKRVVEKVGGFIVEVLVDFFEEGDALAFEQEMIAAYGRSNFGGILCNITAGGEGQSGVVMPTEVRAKIAAANRGRPKPVHVRAAVSAAQRGVPNPASQNAAHSIRMTGAGNPNFGAKNSAATIAKRVATRGNKCSGAAHPFFGVKRPQHVVDVLREKQSKPVIDRVTGVKYSSVKEAAAIIGKSTATVSRWLTGVRTNPTNLEFA